MRCVPLWATLSPLTWVVLSALSLAQQPGDKVVTRIETALRVNNRIVENLPLSSSLTVEKVQGNWLWAKSKTGAVGWVQKSEVLLMAPDSPDRSERDSSPAKAQSDQDKPTERPLVGGTGTAFVVHPDGYLLTNAHVVRGGEKVRIEDSLIEVVLGKRTLPAELVVLDATRDLAILKVKAQGLPSIPLADSDKVRLGEEVRAIGFPLGYSLGSSAKVTRGTISGIETTPQGKQFQTDTTINPGNSGGPVINAKGFVVGIATAKVVREDVDNIGICIPLNEVRGLLEKAGVTPQPTIEVDTVEPVELVDLMLPAVALVKNTSLLWSIEAHKKSVRKVVLSRDESKFVTCPYWEKQVRIWSTTTGALIQEINFEGTPSDIALFPDGQRLAIAEDKKLIVWDISKKSGTAVAEHDDSFTSYIRCVAVSPDGKQIATGSKTTTRIYHPDGQIVKTIQHSDHLEEVTYVEFSPDSRQLLTRANQQICTWDIESGNLSKSFPIRSASFRGFYANHPDRVFMDPAEGLPGIFDLSGQRLVTVGKDAAGGFSLSGDGQRLVTAGYNGGLEVSDAQTGKSLFRSWLKGGFPRLEGVASALSTASSHDGSLVISAHDNGLVRCWRWQPKAAQMPVVEPINYSGRLHEKFAFSPTGDRVVGIRHEWGGTPSERLPAELVVVDTQSTTVLNKVPAQEQLTEEIAYSPDGRFVAAGGDLRGAKGKVLLTIWNAESWEVLRSTPIEANAIHAVAFSPDSRQVAVLVSGKNGLAVEIRDVKSSKQEKSISWSNGKWGERLTYSPLGKFLAMGNSYGKLALVNVEAERVLKEFDCPGQVRSIAFSPDGQWLIAGGYAGEANGKISAWDVETLELVHQLQLPGDPKGQARAIAFSPDGKWLITDSEQTLSLWSLSNRKVVREFEGGFANSIGFAESGAYVLWISYPNKLNRVRLD